MDLLKEFVTEKCTQQQERAPAVEENSIEKEKINRSQIILQKNSCTTFTETLPCIQSIIHLKSYYKKFTNSS